MQTQTHRAIQTTFSFCPNDIAKSKEQIKAYIKQLNAVEEKPSGSVRILQAANMIESYVGATEQRPDPYELYALGSYIIDDYLTDQHKHHRKDEYPFKTDGRMKKNHARNRTVFLGDRTDISN